MFKAFSSRMIGEDHILYTYKNCFNKLCRQIKYKNKSGYHIVAYPERNWTKRNNWYDVCELRSGMFCIAQKLDIPIIPMALDHMRMDIHMDTYHYRIKVGKPVIVNDIKKSMNIVHSFLSKTLKSFKYKGY